MTKGRIATLALFLFTSSIAMFWGFFLEKAAKGRMADFKLAYYDAQCLLNHGDPYSEREMWRVYTAEGGQDSSGCPTAKAGYSKHAIAGLLPHCIPLHSSVCDACLGASSPHLDGADGRGADPCGILDVGDGCRECTGHLLLYGLFHPCE